MSYLAIAIIIILTSSSSYCNGICTVIWGVMTYCVLIGIFIIVPTTQYVWINQTATFTCAHDSEQTIFLDIPGVSEDTDIDSLPGGGQRATATFTATLDTNGTNVTCGAIVGSIIEYTDVVQVFVQGIDHTLIPQ